MKRTAAAWLIAVGGLLAYEMYAVLNGTPGDTLSEAVWKYGQHPLVGLAVGILIGHFWWQRRPPKALLIVLALPLLLGADKCAVSWPQPQPTPTATPAPTPEPTPEPTPAPTPTPEPTPTPTPTPAPGACPAVVADGIATGRREMTAKHHVGRWYDTTPRVCGNVPLCVAVGRPTQYCCPLGPEGEDTFREACEALFLGGPTPLWQAEGSISFEPSALTWLVNPFGTGRIRSCDRAGQTCSEWLDVAQ